MGIFRLQDNTPSVYTERSRDFQLLCHAFDCVNASVRSEINGMTTILDTQTCINRVIQLLQTKLGFFTTYDYNDDDIRMVLIGFAEMVRNKGSKKAIEEAINVFLRISKINSIGKVIVNNNIHTIQIVLKVEPINTTILDEILRYIVPTGYDVVYYFSKEFSASSSINVDNMAYTLGISNYLNAEVAPTSDSSISPVFINTSINAPNENYSGLYQMVGVVEIASQDDTTLNADILNGSQFPSV